MVRGQADFGLYAVKKVSASISDMGEVAARLGSIVIFDKRGDVVDFDNFEEPLLKWSTGVVGASSYVRLNSDRAKSGSQALKFYTGGGAEDSAYIKKTISLLASKRFGIEFSFNIGTNGFDIWLELYHYTGTVKNYAFLQINPVERKVYVSNELGAPVEVATLGELHTEAGWFYTVKLVVDVDTSKYVRLLFSNNQYDIPTIPLQSNADATAPGVEIWLWTYNNSKAGGSYWLDDFIFTQEEP